MAGGTVWGVAESAPLDLMALWRNCSDKCRRCERLSRRLVLCGRGIFRTLFRWLAGASCDIGPEPADAEYGDPRPFQARLQIWPVSGWREKNEKNSKLRR